MTLHWLARSPYVHMCWLIFLHEPILTILRSVRHTDEVFH